MLFQDAVSLANRPPFHNTTTIVLLVLFQFLLKILCAEFHLHDTLQRFFLLLETSIMSHHLRDAHRRGLWLWPFGSTPPIQPSWVYIFLIVLLPFIAQRVLWFIERKKEQQVIKQDIV